MALKKEELTKEGVFKRQFSVTPEMTDEEQRMSVLSIATAMQDLAGDQLIDLGIGFDVTSAQDLLWVVVWSEFVFTQFPKVSEKLTLYTWPGKKMHWIYPRRAYLFDESGKEVAHAAYLWMLMDAKTRKQTEDNGVLGVLPHAAVDGECKIPPMRIPFPDSYSESFSRSVRPEEIDENGHVNNSHYLNWAVEAAKCAGMDPHRLQKIWINYKKEILPEETVTLSCERVEDALYITGTGAEEKFDVKMIFDLTTEGSV